MFWVGHYMMHPLNLKPQFCGLFFLKKQIFGQLSIRILETIAP